MVDDAIVVIENVQRHIAMEHSDPHEATSRAMGEVTSAVIATSLVLIAVFVPVSFFPGTTGILYRQFSLTIAFSIAISAFNALTLSPALSALFLRGEEARPRQLDFLHIRPVSRAFAAFIHGADAFIAWLGSTYARVIHVALRLRYLLLLVFFAGLGATVWMYRSVPTGFIPQEDQGYFMVIVQAPPGSSLAYTTSLAERGRSDHCAESRCGRVVSDHGLQLRRQRVERRHDVCETRPRRTGAWQRKADGKPTRQPTLSRILRPKLQMLMFMPNGGLVEPFEPPAVQGVGSFGGFQFMLQDQGGNTLDRSGPRGAPDCGRQALAQGSDRPVHNLLRQRSAGAGHHRSREGQGDGRFDHADRHHAQRLHGLGVHQRLRLQQPHLSRLCAGRPAVPHECERPAQLLRALRLRPDGSARQPGHGRRERGSAGDHALQSLPRGGDRRLGRARLQLRAGARRHGGAGDGEHDARHELTSGPASRSTKSSRAAKRCIIFGLGILVVYLTLSAQYESFALPFIILLAVPMAVLGALGLVSLRGLANDVYCQIGLVMLIGLSAKNSILIVEFAEQLRRKGRSIAEAAIEAAELRLRPILMTSFAFILGVLPLVFATGAGALGRQSVGTTIVGGMLLSTVLNLVFIPVLYVILSRLLRRGDAAEAAAEA